MKTDAQRALSAIGGADLAALRTLLNRNPDLAADAQLLNTAALFGQPAAARLLLSHGADPDALVPSHEQYRPLHRAIEHRGVKQTPGHREVIDILLEAGASLEARSTWRQITPLAVAGMVGDEEVIELLLENGAEENIFSAAITADLGTVRKFLKKTPSTVKDENNMTVLHYVALSGMKAEEYLGALASLLLERGADGDAREQIGPYPETSVLHFAANKSLAVAEVLLKHGCDPNTGFGTVLWRQPGAMAELFLAHGADVNRREATGEPMLSNRVRWNISSVVLWLLKNGADPTLTDPSGNTPLHEAAKRGVSPKVVKALLDAGANRSARNALGETPKDIAEAKNRTGLVSLL